MFKIVNQADDLIKVFMVRAIVFMEEQSVAYTEEMDDQEFSALHILGEMDQEPIAAGRVRFLGDYAKLERICIRQAWRGRGLGQELVAYMMAVSREKGFRKFKMHAQAHLADFYGRHGFEIRGDLFYEANIPHYLMVHEPDED